MCGEISPERSELRQQSLEGCRIRDLAGGESPKGWLWRGPSREGRWGRCVSYEWVSGGVGKRPSSGDGARHRQSRLRDSPPGQGSWSRVSANRICWHIWNSICGIAAMPTCRASVHKNLGTPDYSKCIEDALKLSMKIWYNVCRKWEENYGTGKFSR